MALAPPTFLPAQSGWGIQAGPSGLRKASIQQEATVMGAKCTTRLQFTCTQDSPGAAGVLALEFTVAPITPLKGFDFGFFEGPGAPAGAKGLMRLTVTRAGKPSVHSLRLGGWLSAEVEDGFVFASNQRTRQKTGPVRQVLNQVLEGAETLEVAIVDGRNPSTVLKARFPLAGSGPALRSLLKGL
ncbi:MAG: hypothetical protein HY823_05625 [Acidobacteria bacterium]|nr:hypothetical protein [Acidobacteriota bacterium]